jgi:thiol-disulfide isomerase/thioredoxin
METKTVQTKVIAFLLLPGSITVQGLGQLPTAAALFQKMKQQIAAIKTISYELHYTHLYGGSDDSIFKASSTTWVERVPSDTIFGSHFHIRQKSQQGTSEYYYDGKAAVDIYHTHASPEHQKTITVMEPFRMRGGNAVQTLMTVAFGYSRELVSPQLDTTWTKHLDRMKVQEEGRCWVVCWDESEPADDFTSQNRVYIDKESGLLYRIYKRSMYRGIPIGRDVTIRNIRINHSSDRDSIQLTQTFPDYRVSYVNRNNYGGKDGAAVSLLKGTRVKDFTYASLSGETVLLKPPKGKLLLLDFWETWCGACFVAMPRLIKLHEDYKAKGLEIVAVVTENREQVKNIVASQKFPYLTIFGDKNIVDFFQLSARPRYILVDDTGTVVADTEGDLTRMQEEIKKRLG